MDHMAPVGVISEIKGQLAAKGYKGAVSSKGATGWPLGHNLKLTLHVLDYYWLQSDCQNKRYFKVMYLNIPVSV